MLESPLGDGPALLSRIFIREAEVDALVDTHIDGIPGQIREPVICERVGVCQRVLAEDGEGDAVRLEEEFERPGQCANRIIGTRSVVWIVGRIEQRLPGWIARRPRITIVLPFADGRDRSPEDVVTLTVPRSDGGIGDRQGAKR